MTATAEPTQLPPRAAYALCVLTLAYVLAFVDRQLLNLLVEPIKRDLALSDVRISLLQGFSFAIMLSLCGLPIGRLLDRGRRTRLLGWGIALWSIATAACGLVHGYAGLLAARIGVGVGEAAMTPAVYSLIGDLFDRRRQGAAMSTYSLGVYIGSALALALGATVIRRLPPFATLPVVGAVHGWQLVFLLIGPAGLLVAAWVTTLVEPQRGQSIAAAGPTEATAWFAARATPLILVNLAVAGAAMAMYGLTGWTTAFFHRRFGLPAAATGITLGLIVMAAGAMGTLTAGLSSDRLACRRPELRLVPLACGAAIALPCAVLLPRQSSAMATLWLLVLLIAALTLAIGSGPAILQQVTPARLRGTQHAIAVLFVNLIGLGLGLGPTAVAVLTDHVLGDEARLGDALGIALPVALLCSLAAAGAAWRPYRRLCAQSVA